MPRKPLVDLSRPVPARRSSGRVTMQPHVGRGYWIVKRTLDIVLSSLGLLVFGPLMIALAVAIKLSDLSAPVFYRQERSGLGARHFNLLKFRTMVPQADRLKEELRDRSAVAWPDFRVENDPRVTRLGRSLRRTSLDELPQLINILKGDMSLVGPRPTSFGVQTYEIWQTGRLDFRPGLTGPWQVWGRDSMDFEQRCRLEISFFRKPSLWAEIRLLLATIPVVFRRTGTA